jgi:hypothetical protein
MSPPKPDAASKTNLDLLAELIDAKKIFSLPWLGKHFDAQQALRNLRVQKALRGITE